MPDQPISKRIPYFGDFALFGEIGRGGMGVVYNAQQTKLDRPVALKVLHAHLAHGDAGLQRLRVEAEAVARLDHPHIVPLYEFGEHEGQPYLAMQLIEGESLAERLAGEKIGKEEREHGGSTSLPSAPSSPFSPAPFPIREAAALMGKVARAVHHAHERGVLHRDLKPGNVLLDARGEPHLIDFGLAKCLEQETGLTQTGAFLGTPAYASPEQAAGRTKSVTTASDIYSLGAILYAVLTGQPPFAGESTAQILEKVQHAAPTRPRGLRPALPVDLETVCLKCLEKEPGRRYASALELAEDLERFLDGRPVTARSVGVIERLGMWIRRRPVHAGLALAAALVVVSSLLAAALWRNARLQERENQSLLDLGSAVSTYRNRVPREMLWSEKIRASLAPERIVTQKSYYRDQVASTLEGWDGRVLARHSQFLNQQVEFSATGDQLLLVSPTNTSLWQVGAATNRAATNLPDAPGKAIAFPSGPSLQLVQATSGQLLVWSAAEQRTLAELTSPPEAVVKKSQGPILSSASRATNFLALVMPNRQGGDVLVCWQLPSGKVLTTLALDPSATALAVSPDGSFVACGHAAGHAVVWNIPGGNRVEDVSLSSLPVRSLAFGPNIRRKVSQPDEAPSWLLAVGDEGGSIGVWNLAERQAPVICRGGHYQILTLAFSPDNMTLASGGRGPVRLWDVATGVPLLDLAGEGADFVDHCSALTFSAEGFRLAGSTQHHRPMREVVVWELHNGRGVATLRGLSSSAAKVVFSAGGERVAAVGLGWEVGVWDVPRKQLLHLLKAPQGLTADNFALAFSPDGRRLALSTGEEAQLWEVASGRCVGSWKLPPGLCDTIAFPNDEALFLLRLETFQGTETPGSNAPWRTHPRVCRLRNLLAGDALRPVAEIDDFNVHVFTAAASSDGRFFAIEGLGATNATRARKILAIEAATGRPVWERMSSKQPLWGALLCASSGSRMAFTTNGPDWHAVELDSPDQLSAPLPGQPAAIGPRSSLWAARNDSTSLGRALSVFEHHALRLNLRLEAEPILPPCFDASGRRLAWGNADGTVSLCDLENTRAQLMRSGLEW